MDFGEYVRKAKAAFRPKLYCGCENCRHYVGRMCMRTQEELTMVCEHWEAKGEKRPGQLEHHTESPEKISG